MSISLDAGTRGLRSINSAIIALSSGWIMIYADRLSISPILNLIRQQFGLTFSGVSLVVSVYFLAYVGLTVPAAIVAERWGYARVMVSFFLLAAFSLAAAGVFGYSYYLLILFMGLHGVGAGAYYPTAYRISNAIVTNKARGLVSAFVNSGMGFGTIAGLLIAGPMLDLFANWQTMLLILSFPTLLVALLLWRTTKELPVDRDKDKKKGNAIEEFYSPLLKNMSFVMLCAAMFCSLYGYWVILTWGPAFLQETSGLNILYSGAATAIFSAVAIPSSIAVSHYSDRLGRRRIAIVILPLASLMIFLMAKSYNLLDVLLAIAGYGVVGKLTLDPVVIAWVGELVPQEQIGSALALLNVAAMSSSILAPIITGVIADITRSLAMGFYIGGIIVLFGFAFTVFAKESTRNT